MKKIDLLNPMQQEAVLCTEGPLLILAGAGSGKTGTMTHRIAHLIMDEGVSPWNILAVTFTNKAAGEMRERVEALIGGRASMWIMTFHAVCLRILRQHADSIGYRNDFSVYDPTDQKVVVKAAVKGLGLDDKKFTPAYVLSVISDSKGRGRDAAAYENEGVHSYLHDSLAEIYTIYENTLKKNNAMDFDDLIMNTVKLFERRPDVLEEYRDRFRYIMVDEYQDTDEMQYRFIKLLSEKHRNLCVVGDDDQCIYQWRGADISNILDFERDFKGAKVIKLEQNYRSNGAILKGANSVIANNKSRKGKKLWTDRDDGDKITFKDTYDEKEEARYVAGEIMSAVTGGREFRDIAVLYRTNAQSRTFEEAFSAYKVPYRVLGGLRYYDRKEIKDMLSYMRLVQNRGDDVSLTRIINEPRRGIGEKTLSKLVAFAGASNMSLLDALEDDRVRDSLSARSNQGVKMLTAAIRKYSEAGRKISDIYDGLMVETGYLKALEDQNTVEAESRIENLLEFKSVILGYEREDPAISMESFLESVSLIADVDNHDTEENAVTLMTLHSAKGLEFPVVFMPGLEEGLFPSARAVENPGGIEEERRLCYVGMTRAMEKLYLTRAKARTMYGRWDRTMESRFLREIDKKQLEGAENIGKDVSSFLHEPMGGEDGFSSGAIFRPFDQLSGIKRRVKEGKAKDEGVAPAVDYKDGDRVRHPKFGEGLVIEADKRTVTVIFGEAGKKKLASDIAPLEKIG